MTNLAQQIKARRARQLLAAEMTSLKQRQHIEGDGSAAYATVTGPQALRAIEAALSEAERVREALERAISFVQALADNDPDEPIADNGMTVLGKLQFDAPALIFKMRAAIGGE